MKIILRDRNQVQMNELNIPNDKLIDNHKPRVIFIEDTNACYGLVKVEGDTGYFDEVDHMHIKGVNVQATPVDETEIRQH